MREINNKPKLADLVDKIIEAGNISPEEQMNLNRSAISSGLAPEDKEAIAKLTKLITEGRIQVS